MDGDGLCGSNDDVEVPEVGALALGERFQEALTYAAQLHRFQWRKGSGIPYVGHLLGVASLVLEACGDEDQVIAALLHDAVEDQGGTATLAEIRRRFGDRVAMIVEICSDPWGDPRPSWAERKEASLAHLRSAPADALLVALADKLYNARALLRDYQRSGEVLWERFEASRDQKLWYYSELVALFQERLPGWMADDLSTAVRDLEAAASGRQHGSDCGSRGRPR